MSANERKILWKPDQKLPYVMHYVKVIDEPALPLDGMTLIEPQVYSDNSCEAWFAYWTNRDHLFRGKLLEANDTEMLFERTDPGCRLQFRIAVMTDEELETVKKRWFPSEQELTKEDLVQIYIEDLNY